MIVADPVSDAKNAGCSFSEEPNGIVTGTLPADGNQPEIVIHSISVARAALVLLFAKEERGRIAASEEITR